jgi:hypothetical protein
MASAVSSEKIGSSLFIQSYDHDPGGTTAILLAPDGGSTIRYMDMKDYDVVGMQARPTIITTSLTKLEIVASATTSFSSVTVVKDSGSVTADSLNDTVFLECTASEVVQLGATLRYVAARITTTTSTDEANVTYIGIPKRKYSGLTATAIT